jgi:hypothetical protein
LREWVKTGLEVASYIPGPIGAGASLVQAGIAVAQGDYKGALVAAAGAVPGGKLLATGAKVLNTVAKGGKAIDKLGDAANATKSLIGRTSQACGLCFTAGTEVSTPEGPVKIEELRVGDKVTATNVAKDKPDGWTAVDPKRWGVVKLLMPDPKGSEDVYEIELLRSLKWIREVGAAPRRFIDIELAEMGLRGVAKVVSIRPSPKIKPGAGRVVLMTVTHLDQGVMEIEFAGLKKALEPTVSHPLFSEDRNDWVPAGQLRVGERIRTRSGTARIAALRWKSGEHRVYNIEVEADHAYFVTRLDLLSHNTNPCGGTYKLVDSNTGEVVRTGRTKNLEVRQKQHARDPELKKYEFEVDKRTDNYAEQRGREQIIHDKYKPKLNKIKPIRDDNPKREEYLEAARKMKTT